jgi:hypothetical protein
MNEVEVHGTKNMHFDQMSSVLQLATCDCKSHDLLVVRGRGGRGVIYHSYELVSTSGWQP